MAAPDARASITLPSDGSNRITPGHGVAFLVVLTIATSFRSPAVALIAGILLGLTLQHPFVESARSASKILLQCCVVGLGFGMDWHRVLAVSRSCFVLAALSIFATLGFGVWLGHSVGVRPKSALLIAVGTAICGGSAIAAIAPSIGAKEEETSVSLGVIFALNACALLAFPPLGTWLGLSQVEFGLWAALAIHDTSSVVGASERFGAAALTVATTVKLVRALWIVPLSAGAAWVHRCGTRLRQPWFILFFCLAVLLNSHLPAARAVFDTLHDVARLALSMTLFLIGTGVSVRSLRQLGPRLILQATVLWYIVAVGSLCLVRAGYLSL